MKWIMVLLTGVFSMFSCQKRVEYTDQQKIDSLQGKSKVTEANNSFFQLQKVKKSTENLFQYTDITFQLKLKNGASNLLINNSEFATKLILDSADFNIWYYKNNQDRIIFLEGNDYYSSIFYAYHFIQNRLFYLGSFYIDQPNVETEKPYKKEFRITIEKNNVIIRTFLNGKASEENRFRDQASQIKKAEF